MRLESTTSSLEAYSLKVNDLKRPLTLDPASVRFSWRLRSSERGQRQEAYRIKIFHNTRRSSLVVWDSDWMDTDVCFGASGPSELLEHESGYKWELWLRDVHGLESLAGSSWFETGLTLETLQRARWISRDPRVDTAFDPPVDDDISQRTRHIPPVANFRKEFDLPAGRVKSARLFTTAHGLYRAHINGIHVGDEELSPGWTDYSKRVTYQAFDVTESLNQGMNAIGVELADGWWSGYVGFESRRQGNHYGEFPEMYAQLVVHHENGEVTTVVSDHTWRESPGPILYTDMLMGEYYDARRTLGPWTNVGYDDTTWARPSDRTVDVGKFEPALNEPIKALERLPVKTVSVSPAGRHLYDLEQNMVGRVRVSLPKMKRGTRVQFRFGEVLQDSELYVENLRRAEATDVYISDGDEGIFEPNFTIHGFRYVEVSGIEVPLDTSSIEGVVVRNDIAWSGHIQTSSDDVNQLWTNIRWGQRGNFVAVPTDCPQRDERLGWMADAQVFLPTAAMNADVLPFFRNWLQDVRDAQSPEGSFSDIAPVVGYHFFDGAPGWADAGVIIPWTLYRLYGDKQLLEQSFDSMKRWVDFVAHNNPDLLWTRRVGKNYGDWLQVDAYTPRAVLATAYFANSADLVARSAQVLGYEELGEHYHTLAANIRSAFRSAFVNDDYTIEGDTQTAYLLALRFDLLPEPVRETVAGHLVRKLVDNDGLLTTGFLGVSLLCPVLSDIGRPDIAFNLLETDKYPSWLYSIRQGATTIWERWDGWTEDRGLQAAEMNSFNHYSLGSVGEWLYQGVAGIKQADESVAFSDIVIRPDVGGSLSSIECSYESIRGKISSSWRIEGGTLNMTVIIPPGCKATVSIPATGVEEVTEQGSGIEDRFDVSVSRHEKNRVCVAVESGSYAFSVPSIG